MKKKKQKKKRLFLIKAKSKIDGIPGKAAYIPPGFPSPKTRKFTFRRPRSQKYNDRALDVFPRESRDPAENTTGRMTQERK